MLGLVASQQYLSQFAVFQSVMSLPLPTIGELEQLIEYLSQLVTNRYVPTSNFDITHETQLLL